MIYTSPDDAMRYLVEANSNTAIRRIPVKKTQPANSIEKLLSDKVECLATILRDIQHKIDKRYVLSCDVIELIDQHYRYIKTKFYELQQWPLSGDRAIELRRSGLEGTLDTLLNEKRREQVQCWQDVADLKKDFWKWFKDYCDVAQRARMVLGDNGNR